MTSVIFTNYINQQEKARGQLVRIQEHITAIEHQSMLKQTILLSQYFLDTWKGQRFTVISPFFDRN